MHSCALLPFPVRQRGWDYIDQHSVSLRARTAPVSHTTGKLYLHTNEVRSFTETGECDLHTNEMLCSYSLRASSFLVSRMVNHVILLHALQEDPRCAQARFCSAAQLTSLA